MVLFKNQNPLTFPILQQNVPSPVLPSDLSPTKMQPKAVYPQIKPKTLDWVDLNVKVVMGEPTFAGPNGL